MTGLPVLPAERPPAIASPTVPPPSLPNGNLSTVEPEERSRLRFPKWSMKMPAFPRPFRGRDRATQEAGTVPGLVPAEPVADVAILPETQPFGTAPRAVPPSRGMFRVLKPNQPARIDRRIERPVEASERAVPVRPRLFGDF